MAKREERSGGGGFGSGAKPGPAGRLHDFGGPPLACGMPTRGNDAAMKLIHKAIMSQGIQTPEELGKFLNERMVGKPLDELAAEFAEEGPKTGLERAGFVMDGLAEDASPAEIRGTAKQALNLSPYCIGAWLALGRLEEDPAMALDLVGEV